LTKLYRFESIQPTGSEGLFPNHSYSVDLDLGSQINLLVLQLDHSIPCRVFNFHLFSSVSKKVMLCGYSAQEQSSRNEGDKND
jgi:hypothetical protein